MILLLKSCLIPWTLSFSMFCITGLGVNFADIDLNQDSKDTLIVRNLRTENLITAIATQGNSNPEALKIANEWVSPISVNAADIAFLQSQNLRTDNVNTVIGTHCCNPKPLEIGNEWVSPKNDDTDRLSEDNFTSYRLSLSINPSPVEISPSLPKPSGDYSVGTTSYHFTDPEREEIYTEDPDDKRELMVRVWYPSEKVSGGKRAPYFSESSPGENPLGAFAPRVSYALYQPLIKGAISIMSQKKDFGGKEQKNNRPQSPENLGKEPQWEEFRHLLMGSPKVVTSIIHCLQLRGYAEFGDWSPFVPNPSNPEQVITILVRRVMFPKNTTK